jgi:hypothetical protein
MSKVATALVSFALGVATTLLALSGSRTFTSAQEPPRATPVLIGGAGAPTVPPITQHFKNFGMSMPGTAFGVDGSDCDHCVFNDAILRYSGGNFQFSNFSFSGPVRVEFDGAAKNTLIFLQFVQSLAAGQAPKREQIPNAPILRAETVKGTVEGSFGIGGR